MKKLFCTAVLLFLAAALAAQTTVEVTRMHARQLKGKQGTAGALWVTLPDGTVRQARIEAQYWDLILPPAGTALLPVIRPKLPPPVPTPTERRGVVLEATGNQGGREFKADEDFIPETLVVYRNGLRQTKAADYTLPDSRTVLFVEYYTDASPALVVADYKTASLN